MVELVGSKVSKGGVVTAEVNEEDKLSSSDIRRSMLGQYRTPKVCIGWYDMYMYTECWYVHWSCRWMSVSSTSHSLDHF